MLFYISLQALTLISTLDTLKHCKTRLLISLPGGCSLDAVRQSNTDCELDVHKLVSTLLSDLSQYFLIFTSASFVISLGFTTFYKEVNDYDKTKIISFYLSKWIRSIQVMTYCNTLKGRHQLMRNPRILLQSNDSVDIYLPMS